MTENPLFQRQRLRDRLKKARESAGLTQRQVAEELDWSPSKVIRIENGKIGVSVTDAMALLTTYGITEDGQAQELISLARSARQLPWYSPYRSVMSADFQAYLAYEGSASIVRNYERNVTPGLLQTEAYTRALMTGFAAGGEGAGGDDLELRVQLRMERQDRVLQADTGEFYFILDEAALRRTIGSEAIMRQQHERLLTVNEMPNAKVMYVPFTAGIYPFFRTPYVIFEFFSDDDDIVAYLETPEGEVLLSEKTPGGSRRKQPADYLDAFWKVEKGVALEVSEEVLFSG
ncbi:helix-turn-helix domain-containing protein [Streptomyces sp. NPDC019443]|uniref:helix-turn-helix domain-containing protein n=1 Tax=Streptomyces sp. NPDC019443 TaxID=3365061 RepID=UPI00379AE50F